MKEINVKEYSKKIEAMLELQAALIDAMTNMLIDTSRQFKKAIKEIDDGNN